MRFAMCANYDMRRSIYEASFVKSEPLGRVELHGRGERAVDR